MKIALIYNKKQADEADVINIFGPQTKETYNPKTVNLILNYRSRQQIIIPGIYSLEGDTLKVCVPFLDVDIWYVDTRNWGPPDSGW